MLLALADIKARLGISAGDTSHDEGLLAAGDVVLAWFEGYCARGLAYVEDEVDYFYDLPRARVYLSRFPLDEIEEVTLDTVEVSADQYWTGSNWIECLPQGRQFHGKVLAIHYAAGYGADDVPADLADVYARCVGVKEGYGEGTAGAGNAAPIKSLGLGQGAIAIGFDTAARTGMTGGYDVSMVPAELQPYVGVLDRYRMLVA